MAAIVPSAVEKLKQDLAKFDPAHTEYASQFVERLLCGAREIGASDVHLTPSGEQLDVRWRIDGVLQNLGCFPSGLAADVVARLKVLAELLTYRTDVPQEGRIRATPAEVEMRVSTFPTLHGERVVVRIFAAQKAFLHLQDLQLPDEIRVTLKASLSETSGAILISGPAGSGKTTTAYACLRGLVESSEGGKSIVALEDPIEVAVPGVAQSQINPAAGFDLASGLRSIMRQDPEVLLIGEIRDRPTAEAAFQASLTGHLVITTFHAGNCGEALSRLADMGIEPYLLRSGILAVLSQRLLRRLCQCSQANDEQDARLGLPVSSSRTAVGCEACAGSGYQGRLAIAEVMTLASHDVAQAVLDRLDARELEKIAINSGMKTNWQRACAAIEAGQTSPAEVRRVLGFAAQR